MGKSGVGSAVRHQEQMMTRCSLPLTESWKEASAVHINTVLPDSAAAAYIAGKQGKRWSAMVILPWRIFGIPLSVLIRQGAVI